MNHLAQFIISCFYIIILFSNQIFNQNLINNLINLICIHRLPAELSTCDSKFKSDKQTYSIKP